MVEDVVTTGLSSREAIKAVEEAGGVVVAEAALVDRSAGAVDWACRSTRSSRSTSRRMRPMNCRPSWPHARDQARQPGTTLRLGEGAP
jgi:orotate phosphoribosyltransferase